MSESAKNKSYNAGFYKWEVLGLLWFAFLLNQADRQIYNTLIDKISNSLGLTSADAGLVATLFSLVLAVCVPLSGFAADRLSKKWIIVFSVMLWSAATMLSGACAGFLCFIIFRSIATGMGEASFGPANYATIADYHGKDTRARAMSIHQTSYYFGVIASGAIAGWIGDHWGWRSAFYIFGGIGVLLGGVIVWRLKDKISEEPAEVREARHLARPSFIESLKIFFTVPTAICLTLSFASLIFVLQAYLTWSTLYLQEKFSMGNAEAGFSAMFYTHIAAFAGILIAGWLSDFLAKKKAQYRILLQSAGLLLASPFIVMMGASSEMYMVYIGFAGFGFWRAFFDANTYSVLYDVIPAKYHASASGVMIFAGFGIGSLSPWLMGLLKPHLGLSAGLSMLSVIWIFFGLLLFAAYKFFYARDCAAAAAFDSNNS